MATRWNALGLAAALLSKACVGEDIMLATFDGAEGTTHRWAETSDFVWGGRSTWTFSVVDGVGVFDGKVVDVPLLHGPGFIKTAVTDSNAFPDIRSCSAIAITAKASNDYGGFHFSIGNGHAPWAWSYGYKANYAPAVGDFGTTEIPLDAFTDSWDIYTGEAIKTCHYDKVYCPDESTLKNMKTMAFGAMGIAGDVHLEIKEVKAVGCGGDSAETTDILV
jgi:hypothetical protein